MKINNSTNWNTKDLKKLCLEVLKHEGGKEYTTIDVVTSKRRRFHGLARINGSWIKMFVPPTKRKIKVLRDNGKLSFVDKEYEFNTKGFSQVLTHEIGHNLGLLHDEMMEICRLDVSYVKDFVVRPKKEKIKTKRNLVNERYEKAKNKVKEYETKMKRTKTLLNKWKKKVKYYEKNYGGDE